MMTAEQRKQFEVLARPLIKFLNDEGHPHMSAVISTSHAEIVEGVCAFQTDEYILD